MFGGAEPGTESGGAGVCSACQYDLRGVRSAECPECGAQRLRMIRFFNVEEFDAVCHALQSAGIGYESKNAQGGVADFFGTGDGLNIAMLIWIAWRDLDRAEQVLEVAGLSLPGALVDVEEPFCPCCGFSVRLDPDLDAARCEVCGTLCVWFSVEDGGK